MKLHLDKAAFRVLLNTVHEKQVIEPMCWKKTIMLF